MHAQANFYTQYTMSPQISYASSSAVLSDRSKYKSFFRNTFNMQIIAPALCSAVSHFNWTRIALLTQDEGLFTGVGHCRTILLFRNLSCFTFNGCSCIQWSLCKAATSVLQPLSSSSRWQTLSIIHLFKAATSLLQPLDFRPLGDSFSQVPLYMHAYRRTWCVISGTRKVTFSLI